MQAFEVTEKKYTELVERHYIKPTHEFYQECDQLSFKAKNLYNATNYIIRQEFIFNKLYTGCFDTQKIVQTEDVYKELPAKVSQQTLRLLDRNWKSFFKSIKEYIKHPDKYTGKPSLPRYKDKLKGRSSVIYDKQAIGKRELRKGYVKLSGTNIRIKTSKSNIKQARIIPRNNEYIIEIVYEQEVSDLHLNKNNFISLDIGLDNLAAITSNKSGFVPVLINGRVLKSFNQFYNKKKAILQSYVGERGTSNRIRRLTNKRNKKIDDYLHKASSHIIDICMFHDIGTIVIGKNKQWKTEINIGARNNQNFVNIPHARFIDMITYKAELVGIEVKLTEESYTSKCSFIDDEALCKQDKYAGRRVKRGLFKSAEGIKLNADVNGSYNIARKAIPNFSVRSIENGIEGVAVSPVRVTPYQRRTERFL